MARQSKEEVIVRGVAALFLIILLPLFLTPKGSQLIAALGSLIFYGFLVLVFAAIVVVVIWLLINNAKRENQTPSASPYNYLPTSTNQETPKPVNQSNTSITEQLRQIDWFQFEKAIEALYTKLGYKVTRKGGANPDGGIDLIIEKDGERTAIQCKQWKTWNLGVKPVREFLGAMTDQGFKKGIVITLCGYTGDAKMLADRHGIEILNETGLNQLLESADGKYDPFILSALNDTRKFCPKCEAEMVLRTATKGFNAGSKFWGCSRYPQCRFILQVEPNDIGNNSAR